jgi:hypothetical protein
MLRADAEQVRVIVKEEIAAHWKSIKDDMANQPAPKIHLPAALNVKAVKPKE